jgi:ribosomal protein S18 acetylase RimI-like enzyme
MIDFVRASSAEEYKCAAMLFKEYAQWLTIDLGFQAFDNELTKLNTMYGLPEGSILLCKNNHEFIGCVGIRKIDNHIAELKRMYIKPEYQNQGIGKTLLEKAIELARILDYKVIRLDTLNNMIPAMNLYKKQGFYEIPAYYYNPNKTAVYFELKC